MALLYPHFGLFCSNLSAPGCMNYPINLSLIYWGWANYLIICILLYRDESGLMNLMNESADTITHQGKI